MKRQGIRLITTGGTFDKKYDAIKGVLDFKETHLPEILEIISADSPVVIENRALVDSLEMSDDERRLIVDSCEASAENLIIITHGTDTMQQTAELIGKTIQNEADNKESMLSNKTIVLTGAMVPYTISGSDALFNLGTAFSAVQLLKPGVYIAMNAAVFNWNNVIKNRELGRFEEIR